MGDLNTPQPPKKRERLTGNDKNQPTKVVDDKGDVDLNDMIDDLEMGIANLENQFDSYRNQRLGKKDMKIKGKEKMTVDETFDDNEIFEFLDDLFNMTKKELMVKKGKRIEALEWVFGIISKGKHVEVIIISDDDTKDDAFYVSDYEDDAFFVSDSEEDAFPVCDFEYDESDADDDTNVMWWFLMCMLLLHR
ncbi:hypothetical protein Tco_1098436 [Tanacetum coccineum]